METTTTIEEIQFVTDDYVKSVVGKNPRTLTEIGEFVYNRTYSRWLEDEKRREYWHETVQRTVNYNVRLAYTHMLKFGLEPDLGKLVAEARAVFKNIYKAKQFPSGRSLWVGDANKVINREFTLGNFNCSFVNVANWEDLSDIMYLLLVGAGVGFKAAKLFVGNMPKIRTNVNLIHGDYKPLPKSMRIEETEVKFLQNGFVKIYIGDSKNGWVQALTKFIEILTKPEYAHVHSIKFDYDSVRPKGERLITFGGFASGYEPLRDLFIGIDNVLKNKIDEELAPIETDENGWGQVRPIHILDISNLIASAIVVGGVRRSAQIFLFDADDDECLLAKYGINGYWSEKHFEQHEKNIAELTKNGIKIPKWFSDLAVKRYAVSYNDGKEIKYFGTQEEADSFNDTLTEKGWVLFPVNEGRQHLKHRRFSNNSVGFTSKPSRQRLHLQFTLLQGEGEPAFINLEAAAKRRLLGLGITDPTVEQIETIMAVLGLNPCAEILLESHQVCNLTTVNVKSFVVLQNDGTYVLDEDGLFEAQRFSARMGLRMTLVDLELEHWNMKQKRDRLIGTSMTGWKDAINILGYSKEQEAELLKKLRKVSRDEADSYARELRIVTPLLATTVKPEGTLSQVAGSVSSGLHESHSPYYIRRIRITSTDPLAQVALKLGWTVNPEVGTKGETHEERMKNADTWVIDFPIESGAIKTKNDITVEEQFETYFMFQEHYTEHNSSNTITVKPDEWETAEQIIWDHWDEFVGVSFLALDGGTYQLAPYEAIEKEKFVELKAKMTPFDVNILHEIEKEEVIEDVSDDDCVGGCPVR